MTNTERAADHAAKAEEQLAETEETRKRKQPNVYGAHAQIANVHATLALFYQREAEREG